MAGQPGSSSAIDLDDLLDSAGISSGQRAPVSTPPQQKAAAALGELRAQVVKLETELEAEKGKVAAQAEELATLRPLQTEAAELRVHVRELQTRVAELKEELKESRQFAHAQFQEGLKAGTREGLRAHRED